MRIEDFDYDLPPELIAQTPVEPRSAARLLVDRGDAPPEHRRVADLAHVLQPGDLIVVNDTRVIPARLRLRRASGGAVEVLLLEEIEPATWECLIKPGGRLKPGEPLLTASGAAALEVVGRSPEPSEGTFLVRAVVDPTDLADLGEVPLPPYISGQPDDPERYQTVYSSRPASAAAPTAGLHFTPELLEELASAGVSMATVELVIGLDTFRPVSVSHLDDHRMHTESYRVPAATMEACANAGRVVAIGTTATRALESAAARGDLSGRTDLFIRPPFDWRVVDVMLTNFHLPRTTLLVMIEAFVGARWRDLYTAAIAERYRMLSFGDAMLLDRHAGSGRGSRR
jgi:S-adenosylmethionine:tRNA ribosyltransferase-isomerase